MDNSWTPLLSWAVLFLAAIVIFFIGKKLNCYYYEGVKMSITYDDCKAVRVLTLAEMLELDDAELAMLSIHYHSLMLTKGMLLTKPFYHEGLSSKQKQSCRKEVIYAERAWARCQTMMVNRVEGLYDINQTGSKPPRT